MDNNNISFFDHFLIIGSSQILESMPPSPPSLSTIELLSVLSSNGSIQDDFLQNLKYWCFHDGFTIYTELLQPLFPSKIEKEPVSSLEDLEKIEQFVITDEKSVKHYCTSLLIYEKNYIFCENQQPMSKIFPKFSIKSLINNPLRLKNPGYKLLYIPKAICLVSRMPIFDLEAKFLMLMYEKVLLAKRYGSKYSRKFILPSGKKIRESNFFHFYCSMAFSLLRLSPQDQFICFQGYTNETPYEILRFHINNNVGLSVPCFDFWLIFEKLPLELIIKLFAGVLLEKQIVFLAKSSQILTNITETLLSLINPLIWGCIYIPFLPGDMLDTLHAMMPYIIGLDRKYKSEVIEKTRTGEHIIIVDIELKTIINAENIHLPLSIKDFLNKSLSNLLKKPHSLENLLKIKQVFLNAMILIINHIEPFFIDIEELQYLDEKTFNSGEIFNFDAYLDMFSGVYDRVFMDDFALNTMMFNKFIEDCFLVLHPERNSSKLGLFLEDASFFFEQTRIIAKNNPSTSFDILKNPSLLFEIINVQDNEISNILQKFDEKNIEKRSLLPYYLNYETYLSSEKLEKQSFSFEKGLTSLNKSIEILPLFESPINLHVAKSPQTHKKLEVSTKNSRKHGCIKKLASYENAGQRNEGVSPSSKLLNNIKNYYFYYNVVKRNQKFTFKRPTLKKRSQIIRFLKAEENPRDKQTPFFKEISPSFCKQKKTMALNPQDSSSEVTPDGGKREPETFSRWLMENSIKTVQEWGKLKENMEHNMESLQARGVTRSVSPKKKGKIFKIM